LEQWCRKRKTTAWVREIRAPRNQALTTIDSDAHAAIRRGTTTKHPPPVEDVARRILSSGIRKTAELDLDDQIVVNDVKDRPSPLVAIRTEAENYGPVIARNG